MIERYAINVPAVGEQESLGDGDVPIIIVIQDILFHFIELGLADGRRREARGGIDGKTAGHRSRRPRIPRLLDEFVEGDEAGHDRLRSQDQGVAGPPEGVVGLTGPRPVPEGAGAGAAEAGAGSEAAGPGAGVLRPPYSREIPVTPELAGTDTVNVKTSPCP